jgi:hypothetical protein
MPNGNIFHRRDNQSGMGAGEMITPDTLFWWLAGVVILLATIYFLECTIWRFSVFRKLMRGWQK